MEKKILAFFLIKLHIPEILDWVSRSFFESKKEQVIVLLYHRVANVQESWELQAVPPDEFEKQLVYLKKYYHVISLKTFVDALKNGFDRLPVKHGRRFVVITFDDGFKDNYTNAFPLLKKYQVPATFYVSTGFIENLQMQSDAYPNMGRHAFMNWSEINEMAESSLVEIGAHTVSHPRLTDVSIEEAIEQIRISKNVLEEKIGKSVRTFAYPFGMTTDFSDKIISIVKQIGFESAPTAVHGFNDTSTDPFEIKRIVAGFDLPKFIVRLCVLYPLWNDYLIRRKQQRTL